MTVRACPRTRFETRKQTERQTATSVGSFHVAGLTDETDPFLVAGLCRPRIHQRIHRRKRRSELRTDLSIGGKEHGSDCRARDSRQCTEHESFASQLAPGRVLARRVLRRRRRVRARTRHLKREATREDESASEGTQTRALCSSASDEDQKRCCVSSSNRTNLTGEKRKVLLGRDGSVESRARDTKNHHATL